MVARRDLRSIPPFRDFDDADLESLSRVVQVFDFPARALILSAGEVNRGLWLVQRGRLRVYRLDSFGREYTIRVAQPGSFCCMGMCPLFSGHICPSYAEALDSTRIYFIEKTRALKLGESSLAFARFMAQTLAQNYRHVLSTSTSLALECSTPRLVGLLVAFARERGRPGARGVELELDIDREVLASLVGTTPQMVARDLTQLARAGVLDVCRKRVVIPSLERLSGLI